VLARNFRFHGYNSLDGVYRRGKTIRGPFTMLKYAENPRRSQYRVAVVVSKKVHKSAVVRNRIRRRIFEIVRRNDQLIAGPYDLAFTVFDESVSTMAAADLERAICKQLQALPA
jgi:ribonuclease P protein component